MLAMYRPVATSLFQAGAVLVYEVSMGIQVSCTPTMRAPPVPQVSCRIPLPRWGGTITNKPMATSKAAKSYGKARIHIIQRHGYHSVINAARTHKRKTSAHDPN